MNVFILIKFIKFIYCYKNRCKFKYYNQSYNYLNIENNIYIYYRYYIY